MGLSPTSLFQIYLWIVTTLQSLSIFFTLEFCNSGLHSFKITFLKKQRAKLLTLSQIKSVILRSMCENQLILQSREVQDLSHQENLDAD